MRSQRVAAFILIILGAVALAYQGVTYKTHKKILDIGPIQATKETERTIPLPPVLGGCALAIGLGLIMFSNKGRG